jgi:hypothetical protein
MICFATPPRICLDGMQVLYWMIKKSKRQATWEQIVAMAKAHDFVDQLWTFKDEKIPPALICDVKAMIETRGLDA